MKLSLGDAINRYGPIIDSVWIDETEWCTVVQVPPEIHWINMVTGTEAHHVYCNRDIAPYLRKALQMVVARGLSDQLKTFDGCYEIRDVRGEPGKPSAHSYACAIDINAATNPLGSEGDISDELAYCFIEQGFSWGKYFHRKDVMHFSSCWE